jgi:hypothetical protein
MGSKSPEELPHGLQNFDDYFNYAAFFRASMDDGGTSSTAPIISIAHAASFSEDFSLPRSTPADDIFLQSNDETRVQGLSTQLNNNDGSEVMEGVSSHFGSYFHTSWGSEMPGHSFPSYMNWETSPNYNLDQDWSVGDLHSNEDSRIADMTSRLDHPRPTEFSHHRSCIAQERSVPVNPPLNFPSQEGMAQGLVLDYLIEAQDVPRNLGILPSIGQRSVGAFQNPNIPATVVTDSQFPVALGTCPDFFRELPPNPGRGFHGPNFTANLYPNHPNTALLGQNFSGSSNDADPLATCCDETSLTRKKEFVQTPRAGYRFSGRSKKRIGSSALPKSGYSRLRKNQLILPARAKSSLRETHHAKSLTQLQTVFGPQEALPSRSDRRKLTANGKKNAREVRGHSCIVCVMKNKRVIVFLYRSRNNPR